MENYFRIHLFLRLSRQNQFPDFLICISITNFFNDSDLTKNPMIVPLKVLRGHGEIGGMGVLGLTFHPRQPWLFSSGADGVINMFQDV